MKRREPAGLLACCCAVSLALAGCGAPASTNPSDSPETPEPNAMATTTRIRLPKDLVGFTAPANLRHRVGFSSIGCFREER